MLRPSRHPLASLSTIAIAVVNVASLGVICVAFHDAHKSTRPAVTHTATESNNSRNIAGTSTTAAGQNGAQVNGSGSKSKSSQPAPIGGGTNSATNSTSKSPAGSSKSAPPTTPASLVKGPPCKTQVPPAGVCKAILSFNTQKDGNPYWSPSLLAAIKQGVATNSYVQLLGLNATTIYNSIQVSINESTWSGNAAHGTIDGTTSAQGQSQATTFTVDWNGSKWIVNDAKLD